MRSALEWARVRTLAADGLSRREIARRLGINRRTVARLLVSDEPPKELVDHCANTFSKTDGDIRETVRCVITSPEFFSRTAYHAKVKTPFELVASALRAIQPCLSLPTAFSTAVFNSAMRAQPSGVMAGEVPNEQRNVLPPVTQRGNANGKDVQPIVEIRAKPFRLDQLGKIHVGGRHQPGVGVERSRAAQPLEFPLLEHAQQLGLHLQRDVAHLVEKQRTAVGELETSSLGSRRVGQYLRDDQTVVPVEVELVEEGFTGPINLHA